MPDLSDEDWQTIASNADQQTDPEPLGYRSGIAVVEGDHVIVDKALLDGLDIPAFSYAARTAQKFTAAASYASKKV